MNCRRARCDLTEAPGAGGHEQIHAQPDLGFGNRKEETGQELEEPWAWAWSPMTTCVSSSGERRSVPTPTTRASAEVQAEQVASDSCAGEKVNMPPLLVHMRSSRPFRKLIWQNVLKSQTQPLWLRIPHLGILTNDKAVSSMLNKLWIICNNSLPL